MYLVEGKGFICAEGSSEGVFPCGLESMGRWQRVTQVCGWPSSSTALMRKVPGQQYKGVEVSTCQSFPWSLRVDILGQEGSRFGKLSCLCPWGQVPSATVHRPQTHHPRVW